MKESAFILFLLLLLLHVYTALIPPIVCSRFCPDSRLFGLATQRNFNFILFQVFVCTLA